MKALEEVWDVLLRRQLAIVLHHDARPVVTHPHAGFSMPKRIGEDVAYRWLEEHRVRLHGTLGQVK